MRARRTDERIAEILCEHFAKRARPGAPVYSLLTILRSSLTRLLGRGKQEV